MEELIAVVGIVLAVAVGLAVYFLPTIIGFKKQQPNKTSIFCLNLFLGWSLIAWVIALVWATKKDQVVKVENNNYYQGQK